MLIIVFFVCYFFLTLMVGFCKLFCCKKKIQPEKYIVIQSPDKIEIGIVFRV